MDVNDKTLKSLMTSLNFIKMRQELISSNIANAETPGYKAKRLDFEAALARAIDSDGNMGMKTEDQKHFNVGGGGFENIQPEIYDDPLGEPSEDGNTVDTEKEMALMLENKLMHDAAIQLLNKKLGLMKYAVSSDR